MKGFLIFASLVLLVAALLAPAAARAAEPFAGGCPSEALEEGSLAGLNHNPRARKAILPAGATSLRICRYYGFGAGRQTPKTQARAGDLQDQAQVYGRDLLGSLTLEFKELEPAPLGPISCPFDEGAELYAVFSYRDAKPVILDVGLSGCRFVGNGHARARALNASLERRLLRLAENKRAKPAPKHGEVKEKNAVAHPPPHLSFDLARHYSKEYIGSACKEWSQCSTSGIGRCVRKNARAVGCRYWAELRSGEVCRGSIHVTALGGGPISESPGVQNENEEGECFELFIPPYVREVEAEEKEEEAQEAERGRRSSRATGQPGNRT